MIMNAMRISGNITAKTLAIVLSLTRICYDIIQY